MSSVSGAAGHAALAICESMLLSLTENKIIDGAEAKAILADAAAAHRHSIPLLIDDGATAHDEAATLIEDILNGRQLGAACLSPRRGTSWCWSTPASGAACSDPSSSCGSTKDNLPDTARSRPLVALLRRRDRSGPPFPV